MFFCLYFIFSHMTDAQKRLKLMKKQVPPFFFINFTLDFELSYMLSITPTIMLHITYTIHISIYIFLLFNESHFLGCRCISWKEEKMMTSAHMFLFELALEKKENSCFSRAFIWSDNFTFWAFFCLNREKDRICYLAMLFTYYSLITYHYFIYFHQLCTFLI